VPTEDSRQALARRLRELRERYWPGRGITQFQLAQALGGGKPLSISLISSWENPAKPAVPPLHRLQAYAGFFATQRSCDREPYRILPIDQLTADERATYDQLLTELTELRSSATLEPANWTTMQNSARNAGFWHFSDLQTVTIVCAQLPPDLHEGFTYANPDNPDYVALYTYADLDALIELYGHVRAVNPAVQVRFKTAPELMPDDYTTHLVLLGGVDWNVVTRDLLDRVELPVSQVARHVDSEIGGFEVRQDGRSHLFAPQLDRDGLLVEDVAHFYRGPNPFNAKRTVTVCNGMFGRGTLGAVRALTDARFRDRNETFVQKYLGQARAFSIVTRISVLNGQVLTPDWTQPETRLHEWVEELE
jgi:hypothetical protein